MKLLLKNFKDNPVNFMRQCGYAFDRNVGEEQSFIRRLSGRDFPRFHAYISKDSSATPHNNTGHILTINLHLDQKRPSYETGPKHQGDYDSDIVAKEITRIRELAL